ncbi:PepSY-associated TM helix domain-containing protein [Gluconobacter sp. OJB]|uniref:PepSY-associated TM helix domain-containing protein n=1 Tax=Gluconobacter sp. OJB TaxID=3145196 RepID=UPI0031FA2748
MNDTFRASMRWLHTWTGVTAGWIIFLIFFNGSIAYFRNEITVWMKPEITAGFDPATSLSGAESFLKAHAPDAASWTINLPDHRNPVAQVSWSLKHKPGEASEQDDDNRHSRAGQQAFIAADGLPVMTRATEGGDYFLQFHYALHYLPQFLGLCLVMLVGIGLMVALTTGIIIHRRIFAQFFTFRPRNGAGSWLDAHTVFAVLPLPFHIMITYTGVTIGAFFLMPWGIIANYAHPQIWSSEVRALWTPPLPTGQAATLVQLSSVLKKSELLWHVGHAHLIHVTNPMDTSATIEIERQPFNPIENTVGDSLFFNGVTGALVHASSTRNSAAFAGFMVFGLHQAQFASPALRAILFLCGSMGTCMTATGLLLWTTKRRRKLLDPDYNGRGFRLVDTLNVGVIAGYPAATAAYFWANRLLPVSLASRAETEVLCEFSFWGLLLVWTFFRSRHRVWFEICSVAAFLFLALPILNALTAPRGTFAHLMTGDTLYIWFDIIFLIIGILFAAAAFYRVQSLGPYSTGKYGSQSNVSECRRR